MAPRGSNGAGRNSGAQGSSHAAEQQQEPVNTNKRKGEVITLNLKLEKTDEFLKRLSELQEDDNEYYQMMRKYTRQTESEKLKASNFPARTIQIGDWHMEARSDNDLVAKFYFAKEQLLWEVLEHERGRKKKIEFNWTDISVIRAIFVEGGASSLHVELENPPKFLLEDPPEPRRHVQWTAIPDFTNGQATNCRWHTLTFAEGILEKHFDKLVNSSGVLFAKNQQPFPMDSHPFFTEDQINESLKNQQDLINKQYSSTATCQGMIQTRQPPVLMVPPIRQIPPEIPPQSFPPSVGSPRLQQSFAIPAAQHAPMNEHATATQSASDFPPTSTSYGAGMNGSFPQQNDWRLKGHCLTTENQRQEQQPTSLTLENQRQEQPTRAYSTPAPNLFPRRVLVEPRMNVCASSIASSSSLNEVTQGIQTPQIFHLSNGQDYNFGSTNYPVPARPFNQNEEHGAPAGGEIHMRNDGNVLESPTDINHDDDELPEDNCSYLNNEDAFLDIDMLDFSVDMVMDLEPKPRILP